MVDKSSEKQANVHTCKTLLNCYIREFCRENSNLFLVDQKKQTYSLYLPANDVHIFGNLTYYSEMGEHEYESFYLANEEELDYTILVQLIIQELKHVHSSLRTDRSIDFSSKVHNSYQKLALFLENGAGGERWDYLASEQSLLYGHPFHPFPKNTEGFTNEEVKKFSPELRTSFQLCYIAVRKDVFLEEWVAEARRIELHETVQDQAKLLLSDQRDDYRILPMHPWQYEHVQTIQEVKDYIHQEKLILLGGLGPTAYPTSSVRTVFIPEMNCNIKLALNIQITNMKRNNNREQMRRTLDATSYLLQNKCFLDDIQTNIAYEVGISSCHFTDEDVMKLFTVAYRQIEFDQASTYVLSSLIETPVGRSSSRLCSMIDEQHIEQWFTRYLDISFIPIVHLADEQGIHFEAHLQNTLVTVRNGLPEQFIIRDLEGVSVDIEKVDATIDTSGPLFYRKEAAWARTSYYFIVNHLGSLIHAIAKDMNVSETLFWGMVRDVLIKEDENQANEYVQHLLTTKTFMAKQNLLSCLLGTSETPSYIPVRNMIEKVGSETYGHAKLLV